jgi:uncharacterized membrane protein YkvA (DUF1232 family)
MIKDYFEGRYREVLKWSIAAMVFGLLYVLNPVDLLPDIIPAIGFMDDVAVLHIVRRLVEKDIEKYKEWKMKTDSSELEKVWE